MDENDNGEVDVIESVTVVDKSLSLVRASFGRSTTSHLSSSSSLVRPQPLAFSQAASTLISGSRETIGKNGAVYFIRL